MVPTIQNTDSIRAAEKAARETLARITTRGGDTPVEVTVALQKEFRAFVRVAIRQHESLMAALRHWKDSVICGDVEFTTEQENDFKSAMSASSSFLSFLIDTFRRHHQNGLFLMNPSRGTVMIPYKKDADRILDSWQSPEWETTNERTVKWNKEQSAYLRKKLDSIS